MFRRSHNRHACWTKLQVRGMQMSHESKTGRAANARSDHASRAGAGQKQKLEALVVSDMYHQAPKDFPPLLSANSRQQLEGTDMMTLLPADSQRFDDELLSPKHEFSLATVRIAKATDDGDSSLVKRARENNLRSFNRLMPPSQDGSCIRRARSSESDVCMRSRKLWLGLPDLCFPAGAVVVAVVCFYERAVVVAACATTTLQTRPWRY